MKKPATPQPWGGAVTLNEVHDIGTGRGGWPKGIPQGIVVHYTASGDNVSGIIHALKAKHLGYHVLVMRDGRVIKLLPWEERCDHAGRSLHNGFNANAHFLGVAFASWGEIRKKGDKFFAWPNDWTHEIPNDTVIKGRSATSDVERWWEATTKKQTGALLWLLRELCAKFSINPQMICGHEECAIPHGRKIDPGGCLGELTMDKIREQLSSGNVA